MTARFVAAAIVTIMLLGCDGDPVVEASAPPSIPPERLGRQLEAADVPEEAAGFALHVQEGVVLTTTGGAALGHLPGWSLDRRRSDRLAAPVLLPPEQDGRAPLPAQVMTSRGLVAIDAPLPVGGGHELVIGESATEVIPVEAGEASASAHVLDAPAEDIWLSVLGDIVNAVGTEAFNLRTSTPLPLSPGCRVADHHDGGMMLHVCDGGAVLRADADIPAPEERRWRWVSTGITGEEVVATSASECGGRRAHFGTVADDPVPSLRIEGQAVASEALLVRTSGDAWVALLGTDCDGQPAEAPGLYTRSATDGVLTRIGDPWPGLVAAAMWAR